MRITATFNASFKIVDRDLFEQMEDEDVWINFLTAVLDSVRYSEDWTKRVVSTEGDELWWDDENDHGIAQVDITFEIEFEDDFDWANGWISDIKEMWDIDLPETAQEMEVAHYLNLVMPPNVKPYRQAGALYSIARWGTLMPEKEANGDGCFLEYESDEKDMFLEGLENLDDKLYFSYGQFVDATGKQYDITGGDDPEDFYVEPVN